jgi:hypothetical protein
VATKAARGSRVAARLHAALGAFATPRWRTFALVAALGLSAPSMLTGFAFDDYILLYELARPDGNEWAGTGPFDLFRWIDPSHGRRLIDGAGLPWWTFEGAKFAFMRPVSSLTHALDHALWPTSALLMHAHSLLWFGLLLWLASRLYREVLESRWTAGVAAAMYALDSSHGFAVGWIANRNALIGGAFGIATLLLHHRARTTGRGRLSLAAWLCFALSVCSAELALAVPGYLLAYALFLEHGRILPRIASLVPYALLTIVWAITRAGLGYGSFGIGAYVDPLGEPGEFLQHLPVRATVLMSSQISRTFAGLFDLAPPEVRFSLVAWGVLVCALACWFVWPALRARRALRFFACGSVLSLVPLTATFPNDRLLVLTGVGVMPVLAQAVHDALDALRARAARPPALGLRGAYAGLVVLVHLVLDPLLLPWFAVLPGWLATPGERAARTLPTGADLAGKTAIVAAVPDSLLLAYLPAMRALNGQPQPRELYWLSASPESTRFERRAPNVLRVSTPSGAFDRGAEVFSPRFALRRGDRVRVAGFTVEILGVTPDGRPSLCEFVFDEPLESPRYLWRVWRDGGLLPFTPPRPGRHVTSGDREPSVATISHTAGPT